MTPEQKAAFINSQTAMMNVEFELTKALSRCVTPRYRQAGQAASALSKLIEKWEPVVGYDSVLALFSEELEIGQE